MNGIRMESRILNGSVMELEWNYKLREELGLKEMACASHE